MNHETDILSCKQSDDTYYFQTGEGPWRGHILVMMILYIYYLLILILINQEYNHVGEH